MALGVTKLFVTQKLIFPCEKLQLHAILYNLKFVILILSVFFPFTERNHNITPIIFLPQKNAINFPHLKLEQIKFNI